MNDFIQNNPALIGAFIGLLLSYFLYSSSQTLSRINNTLDKHMEMILALIKKQERLEGELSRNKNERDN